MNCFNKRFCRFLELIVVGLRSLDVGPEEELGVVEADEGRFDERDVEGLEFPGEEVGLDELPIAVYW